MIAAAAVIVFLVVVIFLMKPADNEHKYTFDPSLKKETDGLLLEKCLIDQLRINIESKKNSYEKGMFVPVPLGLHDRMGKLNASAIDFLDANSISTLFDFDFDNPDNCNATQTSTPYYNIYAFKIYDNIRRAYGQQLRSILGQSSLPLSYSFVRPVGPYSVNEDYYPRLNGPLAPTPANLRIDTAYDPNLLKQIPVLAKSRLDTLLGRLNARAIVADDQIKKNQQNNSKLVDEYTNSRLDINDKAIRYGIVAFCFTALTMYIAGLLARNRLKRLGTSTNPNFSEDLRSSMWNSVYLITVLLLIITIFILGLARLLTENSLAALLGSIAGYVLNTRVGQSNSPGAPAANPGVQATPVRT